ncbi:omega-amidase NIT2 [Culex quinquefasciatus]|uniref:omega-amidase NIT2 n=1 Tax=Culex quinquefasciatus TaxID=7176 RepID=UPI0018E36C9E|nr:omega-amidase NIT2 [Culex quinquefasciatus]
MAPSKLKIALLQLDSFPTKQAAISNALTQIRSAAKAKGAKLVILPECWNSTYSADEFERSAEKIPGGETSVALANTAKELGIWLVGGTYPEVDAGKIHNTCAVFGPQGEFIGKYRKMHLFDMDIPGICTFSESSVLTPGKEFLTFSVEGLNVGIGICYDQRFPEFAAIHRQLGTDFLIFPSAFDTYTGPMHFELIARARALDNSMFVALCAPARDTSKDYVAYGYSTLCDPWGRVVCRAGEHPEMLVVDLDLTLLEDIKKKIPVLKQKRNDVYELVRKK